MLLRLTPEFYSLIHSVDVWRSVESQLLQDHREAGGGGAGVPDRGGAHLQPFLRASGEVRRLLRGREAGVSSHHNHKCHHAGEWDTGAVEYLHKGPDPLVDQAERPRRNLQSCEDRSQRCTSAKEAFSLSFSSQTGKKVHFLSKFDWFSAVIIQSWSTSALHFSCWKSDHLSQIKNMFTWLLWSIRHVNVGKRTSHS